MARSKTPKKRSGKSGSATGFDLADPLTNSLVTAGVLILLGCINYFCDPDDTTEEAFNYGHFDDIAQPGYLGKLFQIFTSGKNLHASWAFTLVTTLHLINSVSSNGGYWANDIVGAVFKACGSGMMVDFLANSGPISGWSFWAQVPAIVFLWYIVNHDIPKTGINVWGLITENAGKFVPLQRIMDLCSLYVNYNILVEAVKAVAAEEALFGVIPQFSKVMFTAVAVHCATDFFNQDGFNFSISGCSETAERAVIVAFWIATAGLSTLPVVGSPLGQVTGKVVGQVAVDGDHAAFLWAMILVNELAGEFIPVKPHRLVTDFLTEHLL